MQLLAPPASIGERAPRAMCLRRSGSQALGVKGARMNNKQSLSHTAWGCVYHVVRIPKCRRKVLYGETRREVGEIIRILVGRMRGVEIVQASACVGHIHMCMRIPPKYAVSTVVGKTKGRSSITLHDQHPEWRAATGRDKTLWARGYYVSTAGLDEAVIRRYIRNQENASRFGDE